MPEDYSYFDRPTAVKPTPSTHSRKSLQLVEHLGNRFGLPRSAPGLGQHVLDCCTTRASFAIYSMVPGMTYERLEDVAMRLSGEQTRLVPAAVHRAELIDLMDPGDPLPDDDYNDDLVGLRPCPFKIRERESEGDGGGSCPWGNAPKGFCRDEKGKKGKGKAEAGNEAGKEVVEDDWNEEKEGTELDPLETETNTTVTGDDSTLAGNTDQSSITTYTPTLDDSGSLFANMASVIRRDSGSSGDEPCPVKRAQKRAQKRVAQHLAELDSESSGDEPCPVKRAERRAQKQAAAQQIRRDSASSGEEPCPVKRAEKTAQKAMEHQLSPTFRQQLLRAQSQPGKSSLDTAENSERRRISNESISYLTPSELQTSTTGTLTPTAGTLTPTRSISWSLPASPPGSRKSSGSNASIITPKPKKAVEMVRIPRPPVPDDDDDVFRSPVLIAPATLSPLMGPTASMRTVLCTHMASDKDPRPAKHGGPDNLSFIPWAFLVLFADEHIDDDDDEDHEDSWAGGGVVEKPHSLLAVYGDVSGLVDGTTTRVPVDMFFFNPKFAQIMLPAVLLGERPLPEAKKLFDVDAEEYDEDKCYEVEQ